MDQLDEQRIPVGRLLNPSAQSLLLPELAGLYVWTVDFTRLTGPTFERRLTNALASGRSVAEGPIGLYSQVRIADAPRPLSPNKKQTLTRFSGDNDLQTWLMQIISRVQRPLYVGITGNLLGRVRQHIALGSRMREYLSQTGLRLEDCALTYYLIPGEVDEIDEELDIEPSLEDSSTGATRPEGDPSQVLRLTEAITIRLAQPHFNRRSE
jgi:hypothetical protein